jgi:Spy/CpxP family protein refolding chaperone
MRRIRWMSGVGVLGLVLASGAMAGCDESSGGSAGATPSASASATTSAATSASPPAPSASTAAVEAGAPEEDEAAESVRTFHRHHHMGGVTMFVAMSIDTLGVDPAKKAQLQKIQADLDGKMQPARDAEHALLGVIADGVAAGTIDTAKVDAAVAKLATASAGVHAASMDAITQLHDALSAQERLELVNKVRAHWEVWQKVNTQEKSGSTEKGSHLQHLAKTLDLTPDQVDKISKALATDVPTTPQNDPKPVDAHVQAFATAFLADKFDPKALAATHTASAGHGARWGGARMAKFFEAVTPVLTADQRTKLAAHLKERMNDQHAASGAAAGK